MLLARRGCRVTILDNSRADSFCVGETIPAHAAKLLSAIGLLDQFHVQSHLPSRGIASAWGSAEPFVNDFLFSPFGNGWHIDRARFNAMLAEEATRAGAAVFRSTRVDNCVEHGEGWTVQVARGIAFQTFECRVIVDAGGRRSAAGIGFPHRTVFDRLIAVAGIARPGPSAPLSDYTLVEAVDEGWLYSALLPSGSYIVAYMTDADLYSSGRRRFSQFVEGQLAKAPYTQRRIERFPANPTLFPSNTTVRQPVAGKRWLAVGDAARSYDPLSGLGICTAIQMACDAAPAAAGLLEGSTAAALAYEAANRQAFDEYQMTRQAYYSLERRWPESEFWMRRARPPSQS